MIEPASEVDILEKLKNEEEVIGVYISAHPLDLHKNTIKYGTTLTIAELKEKKNNNIQTSFTIGGITSGVRFGKDKNGFDFAAVSSQSKIVNANRVQIHALAYNIFNWFKRLVLPKKLQKHTVDTIRVKLLKIAAKAVRSARYITFKLCSSCPYKEEFYETLENIHGLQLNLE